MAGGYTFDDWKRTGGHPLLFTEWVRGGGDDLAALVLHRAAATGADAVELVRAAAILDRGAPLADLASLAELTPAAARVAADRLVRQALLVEQGGLWRVPHDVIAELIQADLAPAARRRWHRRALAHLEASGAAPAELAHHALGAGDHDRHDRPQPGGRRPGLRGLRQPGGRRALRARPGAARDRSRATSGRPARPTVKACFGGPCSARRGH